MALNHAELESIQSNEFQTYLNNRVKLNERINIYKNDEVFMNQMLKMDSTTKKPPKKPKLRPTTTSSSSSSLPPSKTMPLYTKPVVEVEVQRKRRRYDPANAIRKHIKRGNNNNNNVIKTMKKASSKIPSHMFGRPNSSNRLRKVVISKKRKTMSVARKHPVESILKSLPKYRRTQDRKAGKINKTIGYIPPEIVSFDRYKTFIHTPKDKIIRDDEIDEREDDEKGERVHKSCHVIGRKPKWVRNIQTTNEVDVKKSVSLEGQGVFGEKALRTIRLGSKYNEQFINKDR